MGFLDDLKKGADNLGNKLNQSLSGTSGPTQAQAEPLLRDLGVLTFLDQTDRLTEAQQGEVNRVLGELQALESQGLQIDTALRSAPPPPPGSAPPPPGGATTPPPPGGGTTPPPRPASVPPPPPPGGSVPPPPPPGTAGTTSGGDAGAS
jgi:hypothetical protein